MQGLAPVIRANCERRRFATNILAPSRDKGEVPALVFAAQNRIRRIRVQVCTFVLGRCGAVATVTAPGKFRSLPDTAGAPITFGIGIALYFADGGLLGIHTR